MSSAYRFSNQWGRLRTELLQGFWKKRVSKVLLKYCKMSPRISPARREVCRKLVLTELIKRMQNGSSLDPKSPSFTQPIRKPHHQAYEVVIVEEYVQLCDRAAVALLYVVRMNLLDLKAVIGSAVQLPQAVYFTISIHREGAQSTFTIHQRSQHLGNGKVHLAPSMPSSTYDRISMQQIVEAIRAHILKHPAFNIDVGKPASPSIVVSDVDGGNEFISRQIKVTGIGKFGAGKVRVPGILKHFQNVSLLEAMVTLKVPGSQNALIWYMENPIYRREKQEGKEMHTGASDLRILIDGSGNLRIAVRDIWGCALHPNDPDKKTSEELSKSSRQLNPCDCEIENDENQNNPPENIHPIRDVPVPTQLTELDFFTLLLSLPVEVKDLIFAKIDFKDFYRLRRANTTICNEFNDLLKRDTFRHERISMHPVEGSLGPIVFYLQEGSWEWVGYDVLTQAWKRMPPFSSIPLPDVDLFKDFFVFGAGGLFCMDVGKGSSAELLIYNPLTQQKKMLPPLLYPRHPVLIHLIVNHSSHTYKVIVAGSAAIGTKELSRKTEVYYSSRGQWIEKNELPGPEFGLNEYQTGVYIKSLKTLFCIAFLKSGKGRGVQAFDELSDEWIENWSSPLPINHPFDEFQIETQIANSQLMQYDDKVFLFSEQEFGGEVNHYIHKLVKPIQRSGNGHIDDKNLEDVRWKKIMVDPKKGTRGLLVFPEFICLPHGRDKFCIFNTLEHKGIVYDIYHEDSESPSFVKQPLPSLPPFYQTTLTFHTLNPLSFPFEPNFKSYDT